MGVWECGYVGVKSEGVVVGGGMGGRGLEGLSYYIYVSNSCVCLVTSAVPVQVSEGPPLADVVSAALCHKYNSEQAAPAGE